MQAYREEAKALAVEAHGALPYLNWKISDLPKAHRADAASWIEPDEDEGYLCSLCRKFARNSGTWITKPCQNKDISNAVRRHLDTDTHKQSVSLNKPSQPTMPQVKEKLNPQDYEFIKKRMRTMYLLAKQNISLLHYKNLAELGRLNGSYANLKLIDPSAYLGNKISREMIKAMASIIRRDMLHVALKSRFIGIIIDESLDISIKEQMVVYYRVVGEDGSKKVLFASIEELPAGDAETITATLLGRLSRDGIPLSKVMSFGSDGATVMTGHNTGVSARLLRACPFLLAIHCILHRNALAVQAASNEQDYSRLTFFPYIEQLGRFFRDSGTRTEAFAEAQRNRNVKVLKMKLSAFTRWLSHDNTTRVVRLRFLPLLDTLQSEGGSDATANGLYHQIATRSFAGWLLASRDILPVLASLSGLWQGQELDMCALEQQLPVTIATLELMRTDVGRHFSQLDAFAQECKDAGHPLRVEGGRDQAWLERNVRRWLRSICDLLKMYFPNMPLMSALYRVLNPRLIPQRRPDPEHERKYGLADLDIILAHYGVSRGGQDPIVDADDVRDGWVRMKCWLRAHADDKVPEEVTVNMTACLSVFVCVLLCVYMFGKHVVCFYGLLCFR